MTITTVGKGNKPLSVTKVKRMQYLKTLTENAYNYDFIDKELYENILGFNSARGKAIHKLMEGNFKYINLSKIIKKYSGLQGEIQGKWLTIKIGEEETRPKLK